MFWSGLLSGVVFFLIVNVASLVYLAKTRQLEPPDYAVVNMLKRIAIYQCAPFLWMATYFVIRLLTSESPQDQPLFFVAFASVGYGMALIGLALPAAASAALVYHRSTSSPHGQPDGGANANDEKGE